MPLRWILRCCAFALLSVSLFASAADDPADPAIIAQANALNRDPQRIFAFVRDQVNLELYSSSLRGARGVLASRAGNSLDRASLLVALLRASNLSARYVQGTLDSSLSAAVISSLFAPRNQFLGCPPSGPSIANPFFNGGLNSQLNPHFWVEYGPTNSPLDPTLKTAQAGQTYGTAGTRFTEIPDALRQKVTVRLVAETYNAAAALFGLGVGSSSVLEQTFETAALYGRPLTIGHFVANRSINGLTASAALYTYSPYLLLNNGDIIRGTNYEESLTNFPLGSIILTGLFLEVDAEDRNEQRQTYRKTLVDRIGLAARRNGGRLAVTPTDFQATLSEQDLTTVNILSGPQPADAFAALDTRLKAAQADIAAIQPQLAALPTTGPLTPSQLATMQSGTRFARTQSVVLNELNTAAWARASDRFLTQLQTGYLVRGWYNRPRIIVATSRLSNGNLNYGLDLVKRDLYTVAEFGQRNDATAAFELLRGMVESSLEGDILSGSSGRPAVDVIDVLRGNSDGLTIIAAPNLSALADLAIPDAARALITEATGRGLLAILPRRPVTIAGVPRYGWLEYNPTTGETISSFEDGSHGAFVDYIGTQLVNINYTDKIAEFAGRINGIGLSGIVFTAGVLNGVASNTEFNEAIKRSKEDIGNALGQMTIGGGTPIGDALKITVFDAFKAFADESLFHPPPLPESVGLVLGFAKGLYEGFKFASEWLEKNLPTDPEVYSFLGADLVNGVPGPVAPGSTANTRVSLLPEPLFYSNIAGADFPGVFKFRVQNLGPTEQTYTLNSNQLSVGVDYQFSRDRISVLPGHTVEVGLCLLPRPPLPPAGTTIQLRPQATTVSTGIETATAPSPFVVPALSAVALRSSPPALTLRPGQSGTLDLTVQNVGNQAISSAPLSLAASPGLTVAGLPATVNVPVGQTATLRLTVTAASSVAFNAALAVAFRGPKTTWITPVAIGTDASNCAIRAGAEATSTARNGLAVVLNELSRRLNTLAGSPDDALLKTSTLATLDALLFQYNADPLTARRPALQSARDSLAAAAPGAVLAAINSIGTELCGLQTTLAQLPGETYNAYLNLTSQILLPAVATNFVVNIDNLAARPRTFQLSTSPLPAGVTATFNTSNITLQPGVSTRTFQPGFINPVLTLSATGPLAPFAFEILVTPVDDPANPRRLPAAITVRPELVTLDNVTPTPAATAPGGIINVTARVFNLSNLVRTAQLNYFVYNAAGQVVRFNVFAGEVALNVGSALQTYTFTTPINTTGFPEGPYRIEATVSDNGTPLNLVPARATFWVGSPISATLTLSPNVLAPPTGITTATLQLNRTAEANPSATLLGSVQTTGRPQNIAILNNIVYVCGDTAITAVDVSDPANLVVRRTFGQAQLGTVGYLGTPCNIANNHLYVLYSRLNGNNTANFLPTNIAVYNLADPINPTFVTVKSLDRQDVGTLAINGTTGTVSTQGSFFNPFSRFIFQYHGQVITLDLSDPANPREVGQLFPPALSDPRLGSPNPMAQTLPINASLTYVASSTISTDPGNGVGRLIIANLASPTVPAVASTLDIPGTRLIYSLARLGNTVLVLGDTLGNYDADSGLTGFLTLTALDISNPAAPVIRQTLTTQLRDKDAASVLALTNNTFVVGGATLNDKPLLLLVDAANPAALRFVPYEVTAKAFPQRNAGSFFYAISTNGLSTYRLDAIPGPQLNARVEIPKGTGVTVVPGSFSLAPTNTIPGADFDTYEWIQPTPNTITWNLSLTGLAAGASKTAIRGGLLDFTLPTFGRGTFALPSAAVVTDQILALNPADRGVAAGQSVTYQLTVRNPLATPQTFNLSAAGISPDWVNLPATVNVAANSSTNVTLTLTPDLRAYQFFRYQFILNARTASGIEGSVAGSVFISQAAPSGNNSRPNIVQLTPTLNPATVSIGRNSRATTTLRLTNTGNIDLPVSMSVDLPGGYSVQFSRNDFIIRPGLNNSEEVTLTFTNLQSFAASGPFTVNSAYFSLPGTLTLLPQGLTLTLTPPTGAPTATFTATVTNTGTTADTFDLAPAGALGPVVVVSPPSLTIAPNATATATVTINNPNAIAPGATGFDLVATSRANPAARALGRATVSLPNRKGVLAALDPSPASTALTLSINNTGNLDDDYSITVSQTTGTATATLRGLTTLPRVSLQGLGLGQLPVAASGQGTITLTVQSLTDPTIQSSATATVGSNVPPPPPPPDPPKPPVVTNQAPSANAGANRDIPIRQPATLDGSLSRDPDSGPQPLTYSWTLLNKPTASRLVTADIVNATQAKPTFTPDAFGPYLFRLTVSDGALTATAEVTLTCVNLIPIANAGPDWNAQVNRTVVLKGDQSYDPDNDRLTYSWRLLSAPANSGLTTLRNTWSVQPYFLPDRPGTYRFSLVVRDGLAESLPDTVDINVVTVNPPANPAEIKATRGIFPDALTGPAGTWRIVSVARNSRLNEADINNGRFVPDVPGHYVLRRDNTNQVFASAARCDTDADGTVDDFDLALLLGQAASPTAPEVLACSSPAPVVQPERPYLNAEPKLIQLTWQRGTPLPDPRLLFLDGDVAQYQVQVIGRGFTIPSPRTGSLPTNDKITLNFSPTALPAGVYEDQVILSAPGAQVTPVFVRVLLTVIDAPQLLVDQRPLTFRFRRGGPLPAPQTLYVTSTAKPIRFDVAVATGTWLMINPSAAQIPANLRVEVDPRTLAPGTYSGLIRVSALEATNSPKEVPVTLIVE